MPRLFTGLEIPPDIGQTLSNLRGGLPGARWIDPENYHVTLRFIGDIDGPAANEIASTLERINRTGTTVVMATHDHHIVDSMRQRVIELELGRLIRDEQSGVYGMDR